MRAFARPTLSCDAVGGNSQAVHHGNLTRHHQRLIVSLKIIGRKPGKVPIRTLRTKILSAYLSHYNSRQQWLA